MFILKTGHQPGVYVPLRALFLVTPKCNFCFMGLLSYPILRIERYGKGPMNSKDDPYFSTLVGPRTHCFQFVKVSLIEPSQSIDQLANFT